ncbi:class II aldolase/adducin family protein [Lysinibacter cavernae]|uniref:Rhamnose utilization protein RhaD (Predicted bifunctional aldolase and dehydrogenase) n=1 Tax=Lysinibacter cavernae TaxID=1640652 RepID=A0A7X5R3S2_9MICO|nr:class II aldolase/adducin family protein [Lysinibacter cavernae]NIH55128.1 rhamnose utilization protein RhaD (predicted bifunctional aldolase and dehydrogenase) [Lysinibacter cavernae]
MTDLSDADRGEALIAVRGLSHALAKPNRDAVILAEGNTSVRIAGGMLVKASGIEMAAAGNDDFVELSLAPILQLIAQFDPSDAGAATATDVSVTEAFKAARRWGLKRPSVEALLHAVCLELDGIEAVGHTHPVAVNSLLCSANASLLVAGSLFPDQIVVLGTNPLLIPYVDPGLPLAAVVRAELAEHVERTGRAPKVIYLQNHGMFALGASPEEVLQITDMAIKVARVILGSLAAGGPTFLSAEQAARIDSRPDEHYRRVALGGSLA